MLFHLGPSHVCGKSGLRVSPVWKPIVDSTKGSESVQIRVLSGKGVNAGQIIYHLHCT